MVVSSFVFSSSERMQGAFRKMIIHTSTITRRLLTRPYLIIQSSFPPWPMLRRASGGAWSWQSITRTSPQPSSQDPPGGTQVHLYSSRARGHGTEQNNLSHPEPTDDRLQKSRSLRWASACKRHCVMNGVVLHAGR